VTTLNANPVTLTYVNTHDALKVNKAGDTMTGQLVLPGAPTLVTHAVTKGYVDTLVTTHTANVALHLTPTQNTLLDTVTVTSTEINTLAGATSNVQAQINTLSTTLVSTGTIIKVDTTTTPSNYLRANGTQVSKTTYADLFAVIGETYAPLMSGMKGQPWRQQYSFNTANSTIGTWVTDTPLPVVIYGSHVVVTKNRVYLLGGRINDIDSSIVYIAPINPDGTLGAWVTGTPLPVVISHSQAIVTSSRVHLLGGYNGTIYLSTVYTAYINPDGTLGAWTTGTSLPGSIALSQTIVTNNRVYLLGGRNGSIYSSTIYTAPINPDGTLGTWVTGAPLPGTVSYSQTIVTNNRVYLLGGWNGVALNTVYTAPINLDGTLGAWVTDIPLPDTVFRLQAIVTNNRVYLLGGFNGVAALSTIYTAPINPDGTLGAWVLDTSILPEIITTAQAIITSSRMYLLGGWNGTISLNTVYSTPFSGGLNNYLNPISINATTFALPDYTIMDTASSPKSYHYIKF